MSKFLYNGHFLLPEGIYAASLSIDDTGKISMIDQRSSTTEQVDMAGNWVIPAFEDAHNHIAARARTIFEVDLRGLDLSWEEAHERIAERTRSTEAGQWVVCHGWNEAKWGLLSRQDLDAISSTHGILLINISYHGALVNGKGSQMLAAAGHPSGNLGRITEEEFEAVTIATQPTVDQYVEAIPKLEARLLALGIGMLHDMHVLTLEQLEAFRILREQDRLILPSVLYVNPRLLDEPERLLAYRAQSSDIAALVGLKLFLDGAIGTSTAAMKEPYSDGSGSGVLRYTDAECGQLITRAGRLGLSQVAMHCIGDAAVEQACRVFVTMRERLPEITTWRFEHFEMPSSAAIAALAEHGGVASVQPNFSWDIGNYAKRLAVRARTINPLRAMLDSGLTVAFGSDVAPSGPLVGIRWATVNAPAPDQRVTLSEAIRCYTEVPAKVAGFSELRGKIAPGFEANFTVLDADPMIEESWAKEDGIHVKEVWLKGEKYFND